MKFKVTSDTTIFVDSMGSSGMRKRFIWFLSTQLVAKFIKNCRTKEGLVKRSQQITFIKPFKLWNTFTLRKLCIEILSLRICSIVKGLSNFQILDGAHIAQMIREGQCAELLITFHPRWLIIRGMIIPLTFGVLVF